MKNSTKLISGLPPLRPVKIWDMTTGNEISLQEHDTIITSLLTYVKNETEYLFTSFHDRLQKHITEANSNLGSANSFARQRGYSSRYKTNLPRDVKAKSRINELILHKLISETASYINNPNPRKQPPSFPLKINLGAVDKQMVSASRDKETLTLLWKCWDKELLIEFSIPNYILIRNIHKWCLPTVQVEKNHPVYRFAIQETPEPTPNTGVTAGVDLGRHTLYTMSVINQHNNLIAQYKTSKRLENLNRKRERLILERKHILNKLKAYEQLKYNQPKQDTLRNEATRKCSKITKLGAAIAPQVGAEITKKLVKHKTNTLHLENLKWVTGEKYGGRWNHARQQDAITHATRRKGIKTKLVNPRNTSQHCHKCGTRLTHNTKTRTVWCDTCKTRLDRDYNAAINIAKNINTYPNQYSRIGDGPSSSIKEQQVMATGNPLKPKSYLQELQLK